MLDTLKCMFLLRHDYEVSRRKDSIVLECCRCGKRSHGWQLSRTKSIRSNVPNVPDVASDPLQAPSS